MTRLRHRLHQRPMTAVGSTMTGMEMPFGFKPQYYDPVPGAAIDTQKNTRRAAKASEEMSERVGVLVDAMTLQLELAKEARADAERSERFTRLMAWCSLGVGVASLAAAIVAIVVVR